MNLIETLNKIKDTVIGLTTQYEREDFRKWMDELNLTKEQVVRFLMSETIISYKETIDFLDSLGFNGMDILEAFIANGKGYDDHDFVKEMDARYGREMVMNMYLTSSIKEDVAKRIMTDFYDVNLMPEEIKASIAKKQDNHTVRSMVYDYIAKAYDVAKHAELSLTAAIEKIGDAEDKNIALLTSQDAGIENTESIVEYIESICKDKQS